MWVFMGVHVMSVHGFEHSCYGWLSVYVVICMGEYDMGGHGYECHVYGCSCLWVFMLWVFMSMSVMSVG